jgi:hypothetical protein
LDNQEERLTLHSGRRQIDHLDIGRLELLTEAENKCVQGCLGGGVGRHRIGRNNGKVGSSAVSD